MLSRSSLLSIFCSKGSSEARRSSSAFSRSRCRFDGLLLVTPSLGGGFRLQNKKKKHQINKTEFSYIKWKVRVETTAADAARFELANKRKKGQKLLIALISYPWK